MVQKDTFELTFFSSGYCTANQKIVNPSKKPKHIKFYAVWALLHVPQVGYVLFDTGYARHFFSATKNFPDKLYRWATPVFLKIHQSAKNILTDQGIDPNEIKYVIISHFHADHIAGISDFENAKFLCSKSAYLEVKEKTGFQAVKKGILKGLLPVDFEKRVHFIENFSKHQYTDQFDLKHFQPFETCPEFELISLDGHAKGQLGFVVKDDSQHIVYATDASWDKDAFDSEINPFFVVKLFIDSWNDLLSTQEKLRNYAKHFPEAKIAFTHCPQTLSLVKNEI
jgi:glyoxylase-like metal-dependent hydrolase (beta-lactamase superfamily II)